MQFTKKPLSMVSENQKGVKSSYNFRRWGLASPQFPQADAPPAGSGPLRSAPRQRRGDKDSITATAGLVDRNRSTHCDHARSAPTPEARRTPFPCYHLGKAEIQGRGPAGYAGGLRGPIGISQFPVIRRFPTTGACANSAAFSPHIYLTLSYSSNNATCAISANCF